MSTKGTLSTGRPSARTTSKTLSSLADEKATKRVNFNLTPEQHTKLKVYAIKQGKTVTELLTEFVEQLPE